MISCPKCAHEQLAGDECTECGLIFVKYQKNAEPRERMAEARADRFSSPVHAVVNGTSVLEIDQHARHWWEMLFNWEQRNQYSISDGMRHRGYVVEQGKTLLDVLARMFLGSHRPLQLHVFGPDDRIAITLTRPFYWILSRMSVEDGSGSVLGTVVKRWSLLRKHYDLHEANRLFAVISSGFFRIWTFPVLDAASGEQLAVVSKQWGGLVREYMTDADKFRVEFTSPSLSIEEKSIIFAAALSIDFDYFENNNRRN